MAASHCRRCPVVRLSVVILGLGLGLCTERAEADEFQLVVSGEPTLTSTAVTDGDRLVITDSSRRTFTYRRAPELDSSDGKYLGYSSAEAMQTLRWPVRNSGAMLIGSATGTPWRESQQQVRQIAAAGGVSPAPVRGPGGAAWISTGPAAYAAAYVDPQGLVQAYRGMGDEWQRFTVGPASPFVPAGGLAWSPIAASADLHLYSIDPRGLLVRLTTDGQLISLLPDFEFVPGGRLGRRRTVAGEELFAVDRRGRLVRYSIRAGRADFLESREGGLPPGAPVSAASWKSPGSTTADVFVVDRRGSLVGYPSMVAGSPPEVLATGFTPGTFVAVNDTAGMGGVGRRIAAVDWSGRVLEFSSTSFGWTASTLLPDLLSPGTALSFSSGPAGMLVSAIDPSGSWRIWTNGGAAWESAIVAPGFFPGSPAALDPASMTGFAVDALGHLVVARLIDGTWVTNLLWGAIDHSPRLVSRRIIPNGPLGLVSILLTNPSDEELVIQIVDELSPQAPQEHRIAARSGLKLPIERNPGAVLEEVYLVPGPAGALIEEVHQSSIPPQQRYEIVAWANRVTYSYIDRRKTKPAGALPSFDLKTHVSLGVVPLPPGELLQEGQTIDVREELEVLRNPGAAAWYAPPSPDPQPVIVEPPAERPN